MRTLVILALFLVLTISWVVGVENAPKPKELGPEWMKDGDRFVKMGGKLKWSRNPFCDSAWCELELSNNVMCVSDSDDNRGFKASVEGYGYWHVYKGEKGRNDEFVVNLKNFTYQDIDGDGKIDGFYENRGTEGGRLMIVFEGHYVEVEARKGGWTATKDIKPRTWRINRKELYEFDNGRWNKVPLPDDNKPLPAADGSASSAPMPK